MKVHTELPICITQEKADTSIQKASWNLRELNRFLQEDGKEELPFYNCPAKNITLESKECMKKSTLFVKSTRNGSNN